MNLPPYFLVFDVESIGLHGEGFALGCVVLDTTTHTIIREFHFHSDPDKAEGKQDDRVWVFNNVPYAPANCNEPKDVRDLFWSFWTEWKELGAALLADCAWPVEARFLLACIADDPVARNWEGPYPLYDLAPMLLVLGDDPLATVERLPDELPAHNPLNDARQSARLLVLCLDHSAALNPRC